MKVISIKQPWASLIVTPRAEDPTTGIKDIENRTWATKFRGRVLIHASASSWSFKKIVFYLTENMTAALQKIGFNIEWVLSQPKGAIIGSVEIVDCVINHSSVWAEKCDVVVDKSGDEKPEVIHNWVLANPIKFDKPIPAKGKLSFWDYDIDSGAK